MEARRVDADSSGARDGVARLSERAPLRGVAIVALDSPGGGESAWIESAGVDQPAAGLDDDSFVIRQGFDQFKTALPTENKYARR